MQIYLETGASCFARKYRLRFKPLSVTLKAIHFLRVGYQYGKMYSFAASLIKKTTTMKAMGKIFAVLFAGILFTSCKKNDAVGFRDNEITDDNSLKVTLTWALTDGSAPNSFVDIDMFLYKGAFTTPTQLAGLTPVLRSDFATLFEDFLVLTSLADGDYTLVLTYYDISKHGSYTLSFESTTLGKKYTLPPAPFTLAEVGMVKLPVKISKAGPKFTIIKQ
jgi:hypothetical protein